MTEPNCYGCDRFAKRTCCIRYESTSYCPCNICIIKSMCKQRCIEFLKFGLSAYISKWAKESYQRQLDRLEEKNGV